MAKFTAHSALLLLAPAIASCSFSFSAGGPDYEKLEGLIADELNTKYASTSHTVSGVDCPEPSETPKTGDTLMCNADVEGQRVRVEVTVKDDDYNVSFSTLDTLFDMAETEQGLSREVSQEFGFDVVVTCGDGVKIVEVGQSFDCTATDPQGDTRTIKLTAGEAGSDDKWEMVD